MQKSFFRVAVYNNYSLCCSASIFYAPRCNNFLSLRLPRAAIYLLRIPSTALIYFPFLFSRCAMQRRCAAPCSNIIPTLVSTSSKFFRRVFPCRIFLFLALPHYNNLLRSIRAFAQLSTCLCDGLLNLLPRVDWRFTPPAVTGTLQSLRAHPRLHVPTSQKALR